MCSIVGAWTKDDVIDLCKLNEYRGQHSHSVSYYNYLTGEIVIRKGHGVLDYSTIHIPKNNYCIVHMQAPTSEASNMNVHPARIGERFLWHNGIVKQSNIPVLQKLTMSESTWDTELILEAYIKGRTNSFDIISKVDGTFSCLLYSSGELFLFRNEISPMFFDSTLCISSTKFEGSKSTDPNFFLYMNMEDSNLIKVGKFETVNNPYYFAK